MSMDKSWADLFEEVGDALTPLPDAEYDFIIRTAEAKKSSNGKPMFVIRADVESGPSAGRSVFNNFVVSRDNNDAMRIFFQQMGAIGLTKDFWRTNPSDARVAETLVNRRFRAATKIEAYQGVERNKFKAIKPAGAATGASAAPPVPGAAPAPSAPPPPPPPGAYTAPPPAQAPAPSAPPPPPQAQAAPQAQAEPPTQAPAAPAPNAPQPPGAPTPSAPPADPTQAPQPPVPPAPSAPVTVPSAPQQAPSSVNGNGQAAAPPVPQALVQQPVAAGAPLPPPPMLEDPPF